MNNKGQSLILFVLLIPLIILIFSFFIESANIFYHKTRLSNIVTDSCKYENFEEYILKNENDASINYGTSIVVEEKIKSVFSKIIGINEFNIKVDRTCRGDQSE